RPHIGRVIKPITIRPKEPIERIDGQQLHVILHGFAGQAEKLPQTIRSRDDRRTRVESESLIVVNVSPAAGQVALFKDHHPTTGPVEATRRGKPTQPAANTPSVQSNQRPTLFPSPVRGFQPGLPPTTARALIQGRS